MYDDSNKDFKLFCDTCGKDITSQGDIMNLGVFQPPALDSYTHEFCSIKCMKKFINKLDDNATPKDITYARSKGWEKRLRKIKDKIFEDNKKRGVYE